MHDPVTDRLDGVVKPGVGEVGDDPIDGVGVVGDAPLLTDAFDDAVDQRGVVVGEQPVLQRRRPRVEHEHPHQTPAPCSCCVLAAAAASCCAWMAVMATVLTMSGIVQPRDRSFTGLFRPWRTGPTATAPAERWTAL